MAKLLCPILISSILLLTSKKYWVTLCMLFADLLCLANIIYFKCYDLFLTIDDVLLVGNMDGAWTSIEAYLDVRLLMFPISTLLWIVLSIPVKIHNRLNISTMGGGVFCSSLGMLIISWFMIIQMHVGLLNFPIVIKILHLH